MNSENPLWHINYWTKELAKTTAEAEHLHQKLYDLSNPLTIEDKFEIRELLGAYASYSRLLGKDLARTETKRIKIFGRTFYLVRTK